MKPTLLMNFQHMALCMLIAFGMQTAQAQRFHNMAFPQDYQPFTKDTLTVLSWNVEHFVDSFDNPYIRNRMEDRPRLDEIGKRIDFLTEVVRLSGADVVVLQEFESRSFAFDIAQKRLADLGFIHVAGSESPDWYMNVVIMSKLPMGLTYSYGNAYSPVIGFKDSLGRPETQRHINTRIASAEIWVNDGFSFVLTGVHLKAGRYERDAAMRMGQIDLIKSQQRRLLKEDKKTRLLLCGDFNLTPESPEMARLKGPEAPQYLDLLEGKPVFSHPADTPARRIDHILMNKAMEKSVVPGSVKPFVPKPGAEMRGLSDHLPMRAQFLVRKED